VAAVRRIFRYFGVVSVSNLLFVMCAVKVIRARLTMEQV
jgi:hypothetical protein